jgi:hypothetical protein
MRRAFPSVIFQSIFALVALFLPAHLWASVKPSSLLIRPLENSQTFKAMMPAGTSATKAPLEKIDFNNDEEKHQFLQNLDSSEYETEELVTYESNDVTLQQQIQQTLANDPLSVNEWSFFSVPAPGYFPTADIDVLRAWQISRGSEHVMIYFWDTGIEMDSTGQPINIDLRGRVASYFNALNPGGLAHDDNHHGTHVASIATAKGDNNYGIVGVVPGNVKLGIGRFLNASSIGDSLRAAALADWMEADMILQRQRDPQIKFVFSNSWGSTGYSRFLEDKMRRFAAYDVLTVTSAGNDTRNVDQTAFYPCRFQIYANTCVAASDAYDVRASFSSWGPNSVHLYAPGVSIFGIFPGSTVGGQYHDNFDRLSGTSQAVPHVSGVAALIRAANPALSAGDVQQILVNSVDILPGAQNQVFSGGRLNAFRALLMATGQDITQADRHVEYATNSTSRGCTMQITDTTALGSAFYAIMLLMAAAILAFRSEVGKRQLAHSRRQNGGDVSNL